MNMRLRISCFILLSIFLTSAFGQTKAELKKKRDAILAEIKYTNELISESRKAQEFTQSELGVLDKQIALRDELIRSIQREMRGLSKSIEANKSLIENKEEELRELKEEYAKLIYLAYKHTNSYDKILYIFASDDFYQAWMRLKHLKDVAKYREGQGDEILSAKALLAEKNKELNSQKEEKKGLLNEQKSAQSQLDADRRAKKKSLAELRKNEKDLKDQLKDKEKQQRNLNKAIERIIAEEIRKSKKANDGSFSLTPEEALSSQFFSQNKSRLPWPVERGVITGSFGTHAHAVLPGIQVTNNGIDISTERNAMVRTVFEGEVSGVIEIPGNGMAVVVKHGGYRTVYSNLQEVLVSKGQSIDTKQSIGVLMPDGNGSISHMEIWQVTSEGMKKLNPSSWIAR